MKRLIALALAVMLLTCAHAEEPPPEEFSAEETMAFVEALFAAATGADLETETALRKELTAEELAERNAANALYRETTRIWLMEAFGYVPEPPEADENAAEGPDRADAYECFSENPAARGYIELMADHGASGEEACMQLTREICDKWLAEVDHAALFEMNADYALWLYAPGTQIDYPVVRGSDNKYYLKRLFNGEKNSAGTLFIDYRNLPDLQDPNTLIYGHHMRNDSMFGTLTEYEQQAYFEANPYMLAMNGEGVFLLELIAGYTTTKNDHCYDIAISDAQDMLEFVEAAAEKSDFDAAAEVLPSDRLVTLSTCAYSFENARYIVIAKITPITVYGEETAGEDETTLNGG